MSAIAVLNNSTRQNRWWTFERRITPLVSNFHSCIYSAHFVSLKYIHYHFDIADFMLNINVILSD